MKLFILILSLLTTGCSSLRDKAVGDYGEGTVFKIVFANNGVWEYYKNDKKKNPQDWKWRAAGEELHAYDNNGNYVIYIIEPNGNLKWIGFVNKGKRTDLEWYRQTTYKKIK